MKLISFLRRNPELYCFCAGLILFIGSTSLAAQQKAGDSKSSSSAHSADTDISGMYSFLKEGEFVQITVENDSKVKAPKPAVVTGFISRFGESENDKGQFLDHFFTRGSLAGNQLTFATKQIHGVWFEFVGTVERGPAKSRAEEGYYVVTGTLTQNTTTSDGKTTSRSREIPLKLFPDMNEEPNSAKR